MVTAHITAEGVDALLERCRRVHPTLKVPRQAFVEALGAADLGDGERFADDLYLAVAIGRADPRALTALDVMLARADRALRRIDPNDAFVSEVRQELRVKLVLGAGGRPGIDTYRGAGPLEKWLKAVALNTALRLKAKGPRGSTGAAPLRLAAKLDSAEVQLLRARHQRDFDAAFTTALRRLTARERSVLKLRFLDGLGLEAVARFLHVDRSTAVRTLKAMRDRLTEELRLELAGSLKLSEQEIDSLVRAMGSNFRISVGRLLRAL